MNLNTLVVICFITGVAAMVTMLGVFIGVVGKLRKELTDHRQVIGDLLSLAYSQEEINKDQVRINESIRKCLLATPEVLKTLESLESSQREYYENIMKSMAEVQKTCWDITDAVGIVIETISVTQEHVHEMVVAQDRKNVVSDGSDDGLIALNEQMRYRGYIFECADTVDGSDAIVLRVIHESGAYIERNVNDISGMLWVDYITIIKFMMDECDAQMANNAGGEESHDEQTD